MIQCFSPRSARGRLAGLVRWTAPWRQRARLLVLLARSWSCCRGYGGDSVACSSWHGAVKGCRAVECGGQWWWRPLQRTMLSDLGALVTSDLQVLDGRREALVKALPNYGWCRQRWRLRALFTFLKALSWSSISSPFEGLGPSK